MHRLRLALLALVLLAPTATARAQGTPIEWGVDGAVTISFDPTVTVVSIPVSHVRVGFFFTPAFELEPRLGLLSISGSGSRFTETNLELGALLHFGESRLVTQPYLRPFVGLASISTDDDEAGDDSSTGGTVGVGLGLKMPFGSRYAFRPEVNYRHLFGDADDDQLQFLFGVSVFTR